MCIYIMKVRIDFKIDKEVIDNFREKFVRKRGDLSNKIEELIRRELKSKK